MQGYRPTHPRCASRSSLSGRQASPWRLRASIPALYPSFRSSVACLATAQFLGLTNVVLLGQILPQRVLIGQLHILQVRRNRRSRQIAGNLPMQRGHIQRSYLGSRVAWIDRGAAYCLRRGYTILQSGASAPNWLLAGGGFPRHVVNLAGGPQVLGRGAMAVQTPLHLQRVLLVHQRHQVYPSVAGGAPDSFVHVNFVIEVDEVRQVMDFDPGDRLAGCPTRPNRLQQRCVGPDL